MNNDNTNLLSIINKSLYKKSEFQTRLIKYNCVEVTTNYLDCHNDYIQLYIVVNKDNFFITDGGYICSDAGEFRFINRYIIDGISRRLRKYFRVCFKNDKNDDYINENAELTLEANTDDLEYRIYDFIGAFIFAHYTIMME